MSPIVDVSSLAFTPCHPYQQAQARFPPAHINMPLKENTKVERHGETE
jgi:hypothetical protein